MSWGLALGMAATYLTGKGQADQIEGMNKAKLLKYEQNKDLTAEILGTLRTRTDRAEYEAVRANVRTKMAINKAAHKAIGEAEVQSALRGTGTGKRATLAVFRPTERMAGDALTDADINLETEFQNITNYYNDTATQMVANLNNSAPFLQEAPGTMALLANSALAGIQYYDSMSTASKAEFKGMFTKSKDAGVQNLLDAPQGFVPESASRLA